jgi:hypothetical protein
MWDQNMWTNSRMRFVAGLVFLGVLVCPARGAESAACIPPLSGEWGRTVFNLEQPPSGAALIVNRMRKADGTIDDDAAGVGDFTNPILKPGAADVLKKARRIFPHRSVDPRHA